ncbi:MAG: trypsin-like peptidase domain-containing protein [Burkholderiales bacterium]|nr:trypsin-like peptidase domain-containing protein [Burkholderiales bacterium]
MPDHRQPLRRARRIGGLAAALAFPSLLFSGLGALAGIAVAQPTATRAPVRAPQDAPARTAQAAPARTAQIAPAASAAVPAPGAPSIVPAPTAPPAPGIPPDASQRAFASARERLLQVRTLLRGQDSQASVGSGFLVTEEGHLITNYHVVSQFALKPAQYRLVYATADGRQGALQLLDIDVVHDLALLKVAEPAALAGRGVLNFRPDSEPLQRGERIHSLGNPLDVGFAVMSGAYNGLAERSYLPVIFFGGSLSGGMSGGPALDERGRVIGVNVAARRDGEQVSFLVPATFADQLLGRGARAAPITEAVYPRIVQQLTAHQEALTQAFLSQPWRASGHAHYAIPVPQEKYMRCWGRSNPPDARGLLFERSDCNMDSRIFVGGNQLLGHLVVRHEAYDGRRIGAIRFVDRYSKSFRNEPFGSATRLQSAAHCIEDTVQGQGLPLRAVMCLRAHKKLPGLFDLSLLVTTLDGSTQGVQGRFDAFGFSFANAQKLAAHYLAGFGLNPKAMPAAARKGAP